MWHLNILQLKSYIIEYQSAMLKGEESSSMKVLYGSLNRDLVSEVQRGCSKCLGSWQNISSLRWPWYNQDETSAHSLTVQGFETSSLGRSCPNSCCVRCSWGQAQQVAWKAVGDVLEDVVFASLEEFQNRLPSPWSSKVQKVTVVFGGHSVARANLQRAASASKVWGNDKNTLVLGWQNMVLGCQIQHFPLVNEINL